MRSHRRWSKLQQLLNGLIEPLTLTTVMVGVGQRADMAVMVEMEQRVELVETQQMVQTLEIQQQRHLARPKSAATSTHMAETPTAVEAEMAETVMVVGAEA